MKQATQTEHPRSSRRVLFLRAVPAFAFLAGLFLSPSAADAQTNFVGISVKVVLDSGGSRPTSGYFYQDSQIQNAIAQANTALSNMGADWTLDLIEIVDAPPAAPPRFYR